MEVVAEADDGRRAVRLAQELTSDVVGMDVSMAQFNGFEGYLTDYRLCAGDARVGGVDALR